MSEKRRKVQLRATRLLGAFRSFIRLTEYTIRRPLQANPDAMSDDISAVDVYRRDAVAGILHIDAGEGAPADQRHTLCFVRQFRFSTMINAETGDPDLEKDGLFLELVAGTCQPGEPPLETFKRETREETGGVDPQEITYLCSFFPSPGACSERIHLYYARVPRTAKIEAWMRSGKTAGYDEDEEITHEFMTPAEFLKRVDAGLILDAKALVAANWLRNHKLESFKS